MIKRRAFERPPHDLEYVEGWGMAVGAASRVFRPANVAEITAALAAARAEHVPIGLRGSGCSYGDASVNATICWSSFSGCVTAANRACSW